MPTHSHRQLRNTWRPEPEPARSIRLHRADISGQHQQLPIREQNWLTRFGQAENFWMRHHRPPREKSSDSAEASTANWLRRQRTNLDRLCLYQIDLLNTLPFAWDPRDEHRTERHVSYLEFLVERNRTPRRRSLDAAERSLARWAEKHHRLPPTNYPGPAY